MSTTVALEEAGLATAGAVSQEKRAKRSASTLGMWFGVSIIALVVLATVVVRLAGIGHPDQINLVNTLAAPSLVHPFGTDSLGRDVFLRTIYASGLDLEVGLITTALPLVIGMFLGLISGFFGGWIDAIIMRVMDALLAFPFIVLIIAFVTISGSG